MQIARLSISVDQDTKRLAVTRAAAQKRSLSAYVATLIEADIRESGTLTQAAAEAVRLGIDPVSAIREGIAKKF